MRDPTTAAVALSSAHGIGTVRVEPVNNCKLGTACPSSPEPLLGRSAATKPLHMWGDLRCVFLRR